MARILNREGISAPKRDTWDNVSLSHLLHTPAYVMADEYVLVHFKALGARVTSPPVAFDGIHGVLVVGKRDKRLPALPQKLVFDLLSFEEKKTVAAQFIRRIDVGENTAEIIWNV